MAAAWGPDPGGPDPVENWTKGLYKEILSLTHLERPYRLEANVWGGDGRFPFLLFFCVFYPQRKEPYL